MSAKLEMLQTVLAIATQNVTTPMVVWSVHVKRVGEDQRKIVKVKTQATNNTTSTDILCIYRG